MDRAPASEADYVGSNPAEDTTARTARRSHNLTKRSRWPKMTTMKRENIKVNLDPDLAMWVRTEAKRRRCSISQVIRELVAVAKTASSK